ncbi:DUF4386 domain-containing protein [Modestobacter sp. I12A-02662]|uniref:DUF4386 domain-containing protein n=1 Tax=Modestobacter sp. I12A-02662 TaxID=1730496 RepID=UPI0034DF3B13
MSEQYEIRLTGHLDHRWAAWFDGMSLTTESDGTTVLTGPVTDQAALHGLLRRVRDLGLPLVSVLPVTRSRPLIPRPDATRPEETDMTSTAGTTRAPIDPMRRTAFWAGVFYLLTFAASIPALVLRSPVLSDPEWVLGSGPVTAVLMSGLLDVVTALTGIATAVVLYRVLRRYSEGAALGFVTTRVIEGATIMVGVIALCAVVTLRQEAAGADAAALVVAGQSLVAVHDWTFVFGPGFMPAFNALLLGSVLYRSGLVPRVLPLIGLVGAPLLLASSTATVFGLWEQVSPLAMGLALPIATWELSLGVWLVVKGFSATAVPAPAADRTVSVSV